MDAAAHTYLASPPAILCFRSRVMPMEVRTMGGGAALTAPVPNHHITLPNPPGFRVSGLRTSHEVIWEFPKIRVCNFGVL